MQYNTTQQTRINEIKITVGSKKEKEINTKKMKKQKLQTKVETRNSNKTTNERY